MIASSVISIVAMLATTIFGGVAAAPGGNGVMKRHVLDCTDSVKGPIISQAYAFLFLSVS